MSFIQTPMFDYLFKQQLTYPNARFDEAFALKHDLTKIFNADLKYRLIKPKKSDLRPQRNLMLEVFSLATTGSGKSVIACSVSHQGSKLNKVPFTVKNNVHFSVADMKEAVKTHNKTGMFHLLDETRKAEQFGQGSTQYLAKLSDIGQICRRRGLNFIRILGNINRMNITNPPHYRFDCLGIEYETERNKVLLQDNQLRYRGYVITRKFGSKKFWIDYYEKKDEFIDTSLTTDSIDSRKNVFNKMIIKLARDKLFLSTKNKNERYYAFVSLFGIEHAKSVQDLVIAGASLRARSKEKVKKKGKQKRLV